MFVHHDHTRSKEKLACVLKALHEGVTALQTNSISMEDPPWFSFDKTLTYVNGIKNKPKIFLAYYEKQKKNVIVKFVQHCYLADLGLAPVLYCCIDVIAGWKCIIMQMVDGVPLHEAKSYNKRKLSTFLVAVQQRLHAPW